MKKITNKTLGIAGIIILVLSYITSATDSSGVVIFPALGFLVFICYLVFVVMSASRLWKTSKNLVLFFIIISILSLASEVFVILNISPVSAIIGMIVRLTSLITNIYIITRLFKIGNKEIIEVEIVGAKKTNWGEMFGTGIIILIYVVGGIGWIANLVKFVKLDFQTPYKAEVFRGIGLSPLGAIIGYLPIKDGHSESN